MRPTSKVSVVKIPWLDYWFACGVGDKSAGKYSVQPFSGLVLNPGEKLSLTFLYISFKNDQLSILTTEKVRPASQQALARD